MLSCSLVLHVAGWLLVDRVFRMPALDLEFELPMDVELGTSEEIAANVPPPAEPTPASGAEARGGREGSALDGGLADASTDAGADAASDARAKSARDAGPRAREDAGAVASLSEDAGALARLPAGAQIAVRVDMARIRESPLAGDVRALVAAIPDWKALLEGSGIDPVEQLDRLLIASPNLQREKIVLAGRYTGGEQVVLQAVEQLASARGVTATWSERGNVRVAPWANRDATERVVALIGPMHFAIARPEDLPRLLAIAAARKHGARAKESAAEALLAMEEREGLSLEVEGAGQFVRRGRRGVPERLRLAAIELAPQRIELRGVLHYANDGEASDARDYLSSLRDTYARNTLVALLGLADPLEDAELTLQERELHVKLMLSVEQTRLILGYVRELLTPPPSPSGP